MKNSIALFYFLMNNVDSNDGVLADKKKIIKSKSVLISKILSIRNICVYIIYRYNIYKTYVIF